MYKVIENKNEVIFIADDNGKRKTQPNLFLDIYNVSIQSGFMQPFTILFEKVNNIVSDEIIEIKSGVFKEIIQRVDLYFSDDTEKMFEKLKVSYKMGILLFGKQGTGKTTLVHLIAKRLVNQRAAIVLNLPNTYASHVEAVVDQVRSTNPSNMIVCIMDEFEKYMRDEEEFLQLFDGVTSPNNILYLACTNYIDHIPARIKCRPSRFNLVKEITSLPLETYQQYAHEKLHQFDNIDIEEIAFKAENNALTIDELKHSIINMMIGDISFEEAIELLNRDEEDNIL